MGNDNIFWAPGSNHTWSLPCTLQLHKPLDFSICISQFSWLSGLYTLRNPALSFNKSTEFCIFSFVVQLLSHVQLLATPWTTAHQASLSFTISWSLLKLMSNELVMPSNHLILCHPLLLLLSLLPSIRVFLSELFTSGGQNIGASASASVLPMAYM